MLAVAVFLMAICLIVVYRKVLSLKKMSIDSPVAKVNNMQTQYPAHWMKSGKTERSLGLICGATAIGGKMRQEDAWNGLQVNGNQVIAIADGVSSSSDPHLASVAAVNSIVRTVGDIWKNNHEINAESLHLAFRRAQQAVKKNSKGSDGRAAATTLIVAIEQKKNFLIGYLGDGAAVLSTGELKWFNNELYPHTGPSGSLSGYLGDGSLYTEPAIVELPKYWFDGGILLLGSDGALEQGSVISTSKDILDELCQQVTTRQNSQTPGDLARWTLERWVENKLTTDDNRTLGILISHEAMEYWMKSNHPHPD